MYPIFYYFSPCVRSCHAMLSYGIRIMYWTDLFREYDL